MQTLRKIVSLYTETIFLVKVKQKGGKTFDYQSYTANNDILKSEGSKNLKHDCRNCKKKPSLNGKIRLDSTEWRSESGKCSGGWMARARRQCFRVELASSHPSDCNYAMAQYLYTTHTVAHTTTRRQQYQLYQRTACLPNQLNRGLDSVKFVLEPPATLSPLSADSSIAGKFTF